MAVFLSARASLRISFWIRFLFAAYLVVLPSLAVAQVSSASVTGLVHDPTGANVVGAKVTLIAVDTNVRRETVSNNAGIYFFANVLSGRYTLQFSASGFQSETVSTFEVTVNQTLNIDAVLRVGNVESSVTVTAQGTQVESSTAQLGTLIGQKEVNDLPLNGRNFTQLLSLTPGATPISVGQNSSGSNTAIGLGTQYTFPSINGQPNRSTLYLVDGMNDNNAWYNTYAVAPIIDTIQEFKINSHNDAQFGQVTGGVVNVVTKQGTNAFHGTGWEYLRNNDFDAKTYFPSLQLYHQNQFGGALGGPVTIPKLYDGRNKTFFEVATEIWHYSKGNGTLILVPTAAQLNGDFSTSSCPNNGATSTNTCQLYDPTTSSASYRKPYAGNQIPVSQMDPYALAFIKAVLPAATTIPGISSTTYNGQVTSPTRQTQYNYVGRIDQNIGTKDFIFFRYAGQQLETISPSSITHLFNDNILPSQQYGASWMHIFNPTTTLQVMYGRTHVEYNATTSFDVKGITDIYGMSAEYAQNYVGNVTLMPSLAITGYWSGGEVNSPASNLSSIHEYKGVLIKTLGQHQLQIGGSWDQINYAEVLRQATVTFSGATTGNFSGNPYSTVSASNTSKQAGNGLASFLLDYPSTEVKRNVNITERPGGIAAFYVQDSWKATPRLTVNYGVRYDRTVIPQYGTEGSVGQQGSIETGDFDFHSGLYIVQQLPPLCSDRGHAPCLPNATLPDHVVVAHDKKIMHGTKTNVGPRIGLAYRVNDRTAIRGGFGITYDNWAASIQLPQNYQGSWPDIGTLELDNTNTPGTAYTSAQNPFGTNSGLLPDASPFTSKNVNYMVDPEIKNPYSEQWNLGIEQQLGTGTILSVNYVGSESHRLDLGGYYNTGTPAAGASFATRQKAGTTGQPFPYTVPNRWDRHGGNGTYNALQVALVRRFASGFAYQAAYTWSKVIDEGQSGWFGVEGNGLQDPYNPRGSRSVSAYNVPQLLTVNLNYEVPFGKGKAFSSNNSFVNYLIGNWQLNSIFMGRSGQNFSVTASGDIANTGNTNYERANLTGNAWKTDKTASEWFNTAAFSTPASGTYGNSGRNILQTQNYWNVDMSLFRKFPIRESLNLELRAETYNIFNHPTLGTPGSSITTPSTFGVITSVATNTNQRLMQFAAKLSF